MALLHKNAFGVSVADMQNRLDVMVAARYLPELGCLVVRPKRLLLTCSTSPFERFGPQNLWRDSGISSGRRFI